jgi:hypothetical protein
LDFESTVITVNGEHLVLARRCPEILNEARQFADDREKTLLNPTLKLGTGSRSYLVYRRMVTYMPVLLFTLVMRRKTAGLHQAFSRSQQPEYPLPLHL